MRHARRRPSALLAVLALLAASPLAAYTVYLKDGSTVMAKEKYRIENGKAIITLLNGTQSFIDARSIDVRRTEEANKTDYGNGAVVLNQPNPAAPAPLPPRKTTISDLIASRPDVRRAPEVRRDTAREAAAAGRVGKTRAGFVDFAGLGRKPYTNVDVASDLQQFFRGQGVEEVEIYAGTQADRPLLEITTNSEASVFRALTTAANALLHLRENQKKVGALELLLTTPERGRAGQFVLTPEMAADLVAQKVEVAAFFVHNVQF
jgi:hypothetical protein